MISYFQTRLGEQVKPFLVPWSKPLVFDMQLLPVGRGEGIRRGAFAGGGGRGIVAVYKKLILQVGESGFLYTHT